MTAPVRARIFAALVRCPFAAGIWVCGCIFLALPLTEARLAIGLAGTVFGSALILGMELASDALEAT